MCRDELMFEYKVNYGKFEAREIFSRLKLDANLKK